MRDEYGGRGVRSGSSRNEASTVFKTVKLQCSPEVLPLMEDRPAACGAPQKRKINCHRVEWSELCSFSQKWCSPQVFFAKVSTPSVFCEQFHHICGLEEGKGAAGRCGRPLAVYIFPPVFFCEVQSGDTAVMPMQSQSVFENKPEASKAAYRAVEEGPKVSELKSVFESKPQKSKADVRANKNLVRKTNTVASEY